jgi:hypothetical protein
MPGLRDEDRIMLPERDRELLTAYVDGELSSRQRRHVVKLLKRSRDARRLLDKLQADSASLVALPDVPKLDVDLSRPIENKIRERRLSPGRRLPQPISRPVPAWMGVAIAASVLVALGIASYFGFGAYFARTGNDSPSSVVQKDGDRAPAPTPTPDPTPTPTPDDKRNLANNDHKPWEIGPPKPDRITEEPGPIVKVNPWEYGPPKPDDIEVVKPDPLGDRYDKLFHPERVENGPKPFIKPLDKVDQGDIRAELLDFLNHGDGFRIDLPSANGTPALRRLEAACKEQKLPLLIDATAQRSLTTPKSRTNYVLYVENLMPDELARLLQAIAAEDRKAAAKKPSDAQFTGIVVRQLTKGDDKVMSELLGVDAMESTSVSKADVKQVLVLSYSPVPSAKNSAEVKRFLESRKPARPGTVRALIVLRSV